MENMEKLAREWRNTWLIFLVFLIADGLAFFLGPFTKVFFLKDWWFYHIVWGGVIAEWLGINLSSGGPILDIGPVALFVFGITLLADIFILYLLAALIARLIEKRKLKK